MHKLGYSHTDVKPANMLFTRSGHVQLCDFGTVQNVTDPSDAWFETEGCLSLENKARLRYYSEKNVRSIHVHNQRGLEQAVCFSFTRRLLTST